MADYEVSKIMWVAIVVALAASIFVIAKPQISTLAHSTFDKISSVTSGIRVSEIKHTAYANNAEGTDGFSTTKPNLNLGDNTKTFVGAEDVNNRSGSIIIDPETQKTQDGDFKYLTYKAHSDGYDWFRFFLIPELKSPNMTKVAVKSNTKYTFSVWAKGSGEHTIYAYKDWTSSPQGGSQKINLTSDWKLYTFTVTSSNGIPADNVQFFIRSNNGTEISVKKPKVEEGETATPYMPSASEVKPSDQPKYIGTYTDYSETTSQDPKKYIWKLNPDYHE